MTKPVAVRPREGSFAVAAGRWLALLFLLFGGGRSLWKNFLSALPATLLEDQGTEPFMARMSRVMLGPLAAIPEPLDEDQWKDITRNLDNFFRDNPKLAEDNSTHYPVLFVPGLFGSQLETKLTHRKKAHWWLPCFVCPKTTADYERSWFLKTTWWNTLPFIFDCYIEELLIKWNTTTPTPIAMPYRTGIDTRTRKTFESVMYLEDRVPIYQDYANWLTQYLGYQPNEQMISQTFDWRLGPETWMKPGQEFDQMKAAIEQVVQKNEGKGVVALSISAGGPFFALFLNQHVDQAWKDKHVQSWVSISPALSGSGIAPMQYISLQHNSFFPDKIPGYIRTAFGRLVSTSSSVSWLFPHQDSFHEAVVSTPTKEYKAHELGDALKDAGFPDQAQLYLYNRQYFGGTNLVPGVKTICLSGYGIDTISGLHYNTSDFSDAPVPSIDDGDNCVTVEALRQCDAWANQQEAPVHGYHYFNASHAGLLYDERVVQHFFDAVVGKEAEEEQGGDDDVVAYS